MFKFFNNIRLTTKVIVGFALSVIFMGAMLYFGITSVQTLGNNSMTLYEKGTVGLKKAQQIKTDFKDFQISLYKYATDTAIYQTTATFNVQEKLSKTRASVNDYELFSPEDKDDLTTLGYLLDQFKAGADRVADAGSKQNSIMAITQLSTLNATADQIDMKLDYMLQNSNQSAQEIANTNKDDAARNFMISLIVGGASILISILLGTTIVTGIFKPMKKLLSTADKLSKGDLGFEMKSGRKDEFGKLIRANVAVKNAVDNMVRDVRMLSQAAIEGRFDLRADSTRHKGEYRKIVEGINDTMDTVVDKAFWYESILDAIPLPISVTDMNMNWTFINKPVEEMLGVKRDEVLGQQCENWNANICKTENCGVAKLRSGELRTEFEQFGANFQVDTSYILDRGGEQIGHIEVVQDITARVKTAQYTDHEVKKLASNLEKLSLGDLNLTFEVAEGDKYTEEAKANFEAINESFKQAVYSISHYMGETTRILNEMAQGNMTEKISSEFAGDFIEIKNSINSIVDSLNTVLTEINNAASQVAAGTRQVSDGSQALSQGATEQASAIEELTTTITQIAAQTRDNAANAVKASEITNATRAAATESDHQMQSMLSAMEEINEASANISKIIKVIDSIAFQTNILALNAAVEAARAGVYGKGFAVVAEEVRNLASKSAEAAKETTAMIETSIKKAGIGTQMANATAASLKKIVEDVDQAAGLMAGIANASNEQATGIAQVNKGIEQVAAVVQNNSATAQQSAATTEELSSQADVLKGMVEQFRLISQANGDSALPEAGNGTQIPALEAGKPADEAAEPQKKEKKARKSKAAEDDFGKY